MSTAVTNVDVVVVGAGFAGLAAAADLVERGKSVLLFEARGRVGGRSLTRWLDDGTPVDLGGQWIGPTQDAMYDLVRRFGIETYPLPTEGRAVCRVGDQSLDALPAGAERLLEAFDRLAATVDTDRPWAHPDAKRLDSMTFATWLAEQPAGSDDEKALVGRLLAGGLQTVSAAEASVLSLAFYVASGGGVRSLLDAEGGAQQDRIVGGSQAIALALAATLPEGTLRLSEPVLSVHHDDEGVTVRTSDDTVRAAHAIVASPASTLSGIAFVPALPVLKRIALGRLQPGVGLKVNLVYDTPFWREAGLSGQSTHSSGIVTETADGTTPETPGGVLTAFSYGGDALRLRTRPEAERAAAIAEALAPVFGPRVHDYRAVVTLDWSEERFTGGCFSAGFGPDGLTELGEALRQPVGRVHFAGTEYAGVWNGYFEGAVRSGREAARAAAA